MDQETLQAALDARFSDAPRVPEVRGSGALGALTTLAGRGSCRHFTPDPVPQDLLELLAALALSAPSKSDIQQRDIVHLRAPQVQQIKALLSEQTWIADVPELFLFCGNNHRLRQMQEHWNRPFANDHLDAFFNAAVDAGIALATAIPAAEALGLGVCPISTIRNHASEVHKILELPDHVFPVAALAIGWPKFPTPRISARLPLSATFHDGTYRDADIAALLDEYDATRPAKGPDQPQRATDQFGIVDNYTWSDDKTRQFSQPEREDFGSFVRNIGFALD